MDLIQKLATDYPLIKEDELCNAPVNIVIAAGAGATVMQQALSAISPHGAFYIFGTPGW